MASELVYRKEIYTEVVRDGEVIAVYKQNGMLSFFETRKLTAAGLDKILGADKVENVGPSLQKAQGSK